MYVIVCENKEGEPGILGFWNSSDDAQAFIDDIPNSGDNSCPNDHYWLEIHQVNKPE